MVLNMGEKKTGIPFFLQQAKIMEEKPDLRVKDKLDEFISETSMTALSRIHRAKSRWKRTVWITAFLAMFVYMTFQIIWLCQQYFNYPVEIKIKFNTSHMLEFPAVTICNLNPVMKCKLQNSPLDKLLPHMDMNIERSLYMNIMQEVMSRTNNSTEQDTETSDGQNDTMSLADKHVMMINSNFTKWDGLTEDKSSWYYQQMDMLFISSFEYAKYAAENKKDIVNLGHDLKTMLISCKFNGHFCSTSNFTSFLDPNYGNCYTFNSRRNNKTDAKLFTTFSGPDMGLEVELYVQQMEYVTTLAQDAGFRVLVHSPTEMPFMKQDGFGISPGFSSAVGLHLKRFKRKPSPYGDCDRATSPTYQAEQFGVTYSKQACTDTCLQNVYISECKCAIPFSAMPNDVKVCDTNPSDNGLKCAMGFFKGTDDKTKLCNDQCPSPCSEDQYVTQTSFTDWPSDSYKSWLEYKTIHSNSELLKRNGSINGETNFAKLIVYYKDLLTEEVIETARIEGQNLISDIGGQFGLWFGLSFVTIGELIEFILTISHICSKQRLKKARESGRQTPVYTLNAIDIVP